MWKYFLPFTALLFSCHVDTEEFSGVYENSTGNQIEISCDSKFSSSEALYLALVPQNGEKVTIVPNEETYDICHAYNGVMTSFGKWDPDKKELSIRGDKYKWKKMLDCK